MRYPRDPVLKDIAKVLQVTMPGPGLRRCLQRLQEADDALEEIASAGRGRVRGSVARSVRIRRHPAEASALDDRGEMGAS